MSTFVLVHGAYHGAWCWHKLTPELRARGHDVVAFDLPAHGTDTTPVDAVSFSDYVDRIQTAIEAHGDSVVLVGHSMAGMVITQAAERCHEEIDALVYLSAYLPPDDESMIDQRIEGSLVSRSFTVDEKRGVGIVDSDRIEELFYADCSDSDVALARSLLRPEPIEPLTVPISITPERFGSIPRAYVCCENDRAITFEQQQQMIVDRGCDVELRLETSHSPFFSAPEETAGTLTKAAENV